MSCQYTVTGWELYWNCNIHSFIYPFIMLLPLATGCCGTLLCAGTVDFISVLPGTSRELQMKVFLFSPMLWSREAEGRDVRPDKWWWLAKEEYNFRGRVQRVGCCCLKLWLFSSRELKALHIFETFSSSAVAVELLWFDTVNCDG